MQACCDVHNHFLWVAPMNKGSTHDLVVFTDSALCDLMRIMKGKFHDHKLFTIGRFNHAA